VIVKLKTPAVVGVPEISPVDGFKVRPSGKVFGATDQVVPVPKPLTF
jgi:hypothetical protein